MIVSSILSGILAQPDITTVCEIYSADAVPGGSGFDPVNAIGRYAAVSGVFFRGVGYTRAVKKFGAVTRTISKESNTASIEFSNTDRAISRFEFTNGFEGLIMVIRTISRDSSVNVLSRSLVLFTGRCEKPSSGNKDSLTVKATWILGGLEVQIPRRKYTREDQDGRVETDPNFEGFVFIPQFGNSTYSVRVSRGGILGFFGFKKTVQKTLAYSSFSDLDANKPVPEVFGTMQIEGTHIAYDDVGTTLRIRTAFCEGEISDLSSVRSTDSRLPLSATNYFEAYGKVGAANLIGSSWVGPGNYSKTACIVGQCTNSAVDAQDAAPLIVGVAKGRLVTIPTTGGAWTTTGTWSDNPAAHTRFILTSSDYFNLDSNWIDDTSFFATYQYNDANIIDRVRTDFFFTIEG